MALADRVTERATARREISRSDPVTMEEFGYLLGRGRGGGMTKAGVSIGPTRAMGLSAWWRGVRYLSETVSSLPVHTYRDSGGIRSRRADPLWLKRPDREMPWLALMEHWMMSLLHRGNAYAFKLRNEVGQVIGLRAIHPDRVRVGQASDGTKVFKIDSQEIGYTSREILHIPSLSYNGIVGLDPLSLFAEGLGIAAAADNFAADSFGKGMHLQSYLSVEQELTIEQCDALVERWKHFHSGMARGEQFGVVGNGAKYNTVSLTPEQQQLIETRKFEVTEIARYLGVVPPKLYDLERATFSNIEQQAIDAVVDGIRPWVERFEAFINFDLQLLPAGNFIEFDLEGLLRGDSAARGAFYQALVNAGIMQPYSGAVKENLPAPDELKYWLRPLNMAVIREGQPDLIQPSETETINVQQGVPAA